jgi:hypothetical protein
MLSLVPTRIAFPPPSRSRTQEERRVAMTTIKLVKRDVIVVFMARSVER